MLHSDLGKLSRVMDLGVKTKCHFCYSHTPHIPAPKCTLRHQESVQSAGLLQTSPSSPEGSYCSKSP